MHCGGDWKLAFPCGFGACTAAGQPIEISGKKHQALLAYLAAHAGRKLPRDKLTGLLWSDRGEQQARSSLRQALLTLRRDLAGIEPSPLLFEGDTIAIDASATSSDVAAFERLAASSAVDDMRRAAALYGGDLLDGVAVRDQAFDEWLAVERSRLREIAIGVLDRLLERLSGAEAVAVANRLVALDSLRESSHRALMKTYVAQGQSELALRQYQACRDILRRELDVEPSGETTALHLEIGEGKYRPPAVDSYPQDGSPKLQPVAGAVSVPGGKTSVAVLPFTNMSGDPEQEYFSDGITEDIITDLSQVSALFVVARSTSFTYKGKVIEAVEAARRLNVGFVLEGSVRKAVNRIRITVQLIDGTSGGHVWAERYDRDLGDIFVLQDDISKSVVSALSVRLLPAELQIITARTTKNIEAYQRYLQARAILHLTWSSKSELRTARALFVEAAEIDPGFARAYAGIADCDAFLWVNGDSDISYDQMFANSSKATELAPNLAEAHASKGLALYLTGHAEEARAMFDRAIALDPKLFAAHLFYGFSCRETGEFEKAVTLFERAADLSPSDAISFVIVTDLYKALGRLEQCEKSARRAMVRIEAIVKQHPGAADAVSMGAATMVFLGDNERAKEWARRAISLDPEAYSVRYNVACTYAVIGDSESTLECLEHIRSNPRVRRWLLGIMSHDTQFDSLRGRPEFQTFVRNLEADVAMQQ